MANSVEPGISDLTLEGIDPVSGKKITLSSGRIMPLAAYGTFHSDWAQAYMKDATVEAIRLGWRHLDTARAYENENVVGEAIHEAISKGYIASADELFITGKLWNGHMDPKDVAPACDATLKALGVDQINMYLNHWPWPNVHTPGCAGEHRNPDAVPYIHEAFLETWAEICKLKNAGKVVDIGTSNHTQGAMEMLLSDVSQDERPVCNQMEMHPLFQQAELRRYFTSKGIVCTGYMAMGSPKRPARDTFKEHQSDMNNPVIQEIAEELGVSAGAVCLAWAAQREDHSGGYVVMSTNPQRIRDNLVVSTKDFLLNEQLLRISGDGTPENPGIDANNRLIWGQVFLWPEADGDWRQLWNDKQLFLTREGYQKYKASWEVSHQVQLETTYQV
jgi:diketogulonate reductase-like aldo/keto reductase